MGGFYPHSHLTGGSTEAGDGDGITQSHPRSARASTVPSAAGWYSSRD